MKKGLWPNKAQNSLPSQALRYKNKVSLIFIRNIYFIFKDRRNILDMGQLFLRKLEHIIIVIIVIVGGGVMVLRTAAFILLQ